jgi:isocitrate lyase
VTSPGRRLRALLKEKRFLTSFGVAMPLHAMICERAGFDYVYLGGYDVSLTLMGLPDLGFITQRDMVENARHVARSVSLPVIVDADTGYGNALNAMQAVQDFEQAGVACIHIEDQVSPKRCGHVAGKMVIPMEEAAGKLRAALDARRDPDFMIMARTDAVAAAGGGLDEAIRRGREYARIGCDMLFCEFPTTDPELPRRFAQEIHRTNPGFPLYFNYSANLKWHEAPLSFEALADMGYKAMHVSQGGLRPSLQGVWDYAVDLKARGAQAEVDFQKRSLEHPVGSAHAFADFGKFKDAEAKYLPAEEVRKRYDGAVGL